MVREGEKEICHISQARGVGVGGISVSKYRYVKFTMVIILTHSYEKGAGVCGLSFHHLCVCLEQLSVSILEKKTFFSIYPNTLYNIIGATCPDRINFSKFIIFSNV